MPSATRSSQCRRSGSRRPAPYQPRVLQQPVDRDHGHEGDADGGERPETGEIVLPVGIDQGDSRRPFGAEFVVVDDDHVDGERRGLGQGVEAGRAAVNRDDQAGARAGQRAHRLDIRPVALEQAVGDIDDGLASLMAQEAGEQRRRRRAIDVVVAEDGDLLAAHDRVGDPPGRRLHVGQHRRVGHQRLEARRQEGGRVVDADPASGQDARDHIGDLVPLGDGERRIGAGAVEPLEPAPAGERALDAEECPAVRPGVRRAAANRASRWCHVP